MFPPRRSKADTAEAEIIRPYAVDPGEMLQNARVARASRTETGKAMLTPRQQQWAEDRKLSLVPVRAHIPEALMVGIARLRYRPRTSATAEWFTCMAEWDDMTEQFNELAREACGADTLYRGMQHQGASR